MNLKNIFSYHPSNDDQKERYESNRNTCLYLAKTFQDNCPPSSELTLAIRKIQEAMFYANAAIALNEKE